MMENVAEVNGVFDFVNHDKKWNKKLPANWLPVTLLTNQLTDNYLPFQWIGLHDYQFSSWTKRVLH